MVVNGHFSGSDSHRQNKVNTGNNTDPKPALKHNSSTVTLHPFIQLNGFLKIEVELEAGRDESELLIPDYVTTLLD